MCRLKFAVVNAAQCLLLLLLLSSSSSSSIMMIMIMLRSHYYCSACIFSLLSILKERKQAYGSPMFFVHVHLCVCACVCACVCVRARVHLWCIYVCGEGVEWVWGMGEVCGDRYVCLHLHTCV
jgi:hypothetical protein